MATLACPILLRKKNAFLTSIKPLWSALQVILLSNTFGRPRDILMTSPRPCPIGPSDVTNFDLIDQGGSS